MRTVAALFVASNGCYQGLEGVDPWDEARDARLYQGPHPVVAHPPCGRWAQPLAQTNQTRYGHRVGDDGGYFASAMASVSRFGGVLEHPANTAAWPAFGLPMPTRGHWTHGMFSLGWSTEISQVAYGGPTRKRTWLYWVGDGEPPAMDWSEPPHTHLVSWLQKTKSKLPRLTKAQASATPTAFRDALLSLARAARKS